MQSLINHIKAGLLFCLPQHAISRVLFKLTRIESILARPFIRWFIKHYGVNIQEARWPDIKDYKSFNAFFTRALAEDARPIVAKNNCLIHPVDGQISQFGTIKAGRILQAKNFTYSILELLGGDKKLAGPFLGGSYATLYLSPKDYHRIHMPYTGTLSSMVHIPGRLYSVAPYTTNTISRLFTRNERVITVFNSSFGKFSLVLVGAINVAAIETVWHGLITPPQRKNIAQYDYKDTVTLEKGAEMGRFNMGSTVILLTEKPVNWQSNLRIGNVVRLGTELATVPLMN